MFFTIKETGLHVPLEGNTWWWGTRSFRVYAQLNHNARDASGGCEVAQKFKRKAFGDTPFRWTVLLEKPDGPSLVGGRRI